MNDPNWVLENVRVTLFSRKHGERVIIQNSDLKLRITANEAEESIRDGKARVAADKADGAGARAVKEPAPKATTKTAPAATQEPEAGPKVEPATGPTRVSDAPPQAEPERPKAAESKKPRAVLEWRPVEDAGYAGFAASSHDGELMLLKSTDSLWALYFFWERGVYHHIQCFAELDKGKDAAEAQHRNGPPPRPQGKITAQMIEDACPAPEDTKAPATTAKSAPPPVPSEEPPRKPRKPRTPRTPPRTEPTGDRRETKAPETKAPEETKPQEAAQDRELMSSFTGDLESVLNEEEDD